MGTINDTYTMEVDALALGLTRAPLIMGVNFKAAFGNLMLCALGYIYLRTLWVVVWCGLLHLIAMRLSVKDARFFDLQLKRLQTTAWVRNYAFWGGLNSYEPW